jgi:gp5
LILEIYKRKIYLEKFEEWRINMTEEETIELLEFLMTDYGRGYLAGVVNGMSILLKVFKKAE